MERKSPGRLERLAVTALVRALWPAKHAGPWPVPAGLPHDEVRIPAAGGGHLAGRYFFQDRAAGAVVLCHPDRRYGQHWFVREGRVQALLAAGFEVLTFDFPGYGGSRGGSRYLHEQVLAACRFARRWSGGLPLHVVGVSLGAFAAANASPSLDVEGLVLESPYPSFRDWYAGRALGPAVAALDALFPRTAAALRADSNLGRARARRILVVAAGGDAVTPPALTRAVAEAAPAGRSRLLEIPALGHLEPWQGSAACRAAVLATLGAASVEAAAAPLALAVAVTA